MVELIGAKLILVAVNEGIKPVPFKPKPIFGLEFVQLYVAPVTEELKLGMAAKAPLHLVRLAIGVMTGIGFTITQTGSIGLEQPVAAEVPTTL